MILDIFKKEWFGFIFTPFLSATAVAFIYSSTVRGASNFKNWWIFSLASAYALTFLLAVPIYFLIKRFYVLTFFRVVLLGYLVVLVPSCILNLPISGSLTLIINNHQIISEGRYTEYGLLRMVLYQMEIALAGGFTGAIFWFFVKPSNDLSK
ncbi:hypothetical protein H8L32_18640 [Undibacterium sp. CY18W]|uniref:Transmembrane protein n=1 Tax=Undibacterium hunanense TaxID=2762292 RepID=A0ABR6ZUE8_9BURK|nr:hypothetical protein [Undibacterium hunanense]MBC3919511.1 hypothetical protein [Undibacterium hunanense]